MTHPLLQNLMLRFPQPHYPDRTTLHFKGSPFLRIDQAVSPIVECPESSSARDRRQQFVVFTLNNDHVAKLRSSDRKYQLRLFCTSSTFYSASLPIKAQSPCLVEFPPTCEIRVNNVVLGANLKGLKKKPGTAPPPDLGKHVCLTSQNRVEMVYANSQQPVPSKKFYLVVMLVESTTVDTLVRRLKHSSYRSKEEKMKVSASQGDDIVAGPQKMSLKCPLSFTRIQTPCRSSKCVHPQCFDATSWYSMMEQTTTWLCPVCDRILDCNDLIIDWYFDDILRATPDSVNDVIVEADGDWHTADNKLGSRSWLASHSVSSPKPLSMARTSPQSSQKSGTSDGRAKGLNLEVIVLDSDEEDEGRAKRRLSPSLARGSSASLENGTKYVAPSQVDNIIDLTLDSDEDTLLPQQSHVDVQTVVRSQQSARRGRGGIYNRPTNVSAAVARIQCVRIGPYNGFPNAANLNVAFWDLLVDRPYVAASVGEWMAARRDAKDGRFCVLTFKSSEAAAHFVLTWNSTIPVQFSTGVVAQTF